MLKIVTFCKIMTCYSLYINFFETESVNTCLEEYRYNNTQKFGIGLLKFVDSYSSGQHFQRSEVCTAFKI
jgi:hypothetical protein